MLRWADNPRNTLAAFRVLQLLPGMGPANARKCVDLLEQKRRLFAALDGFTPPSGSGPDFARLQKLMATLAEPQRPWAGQVRLVRDWYVPHLERIHEQAHTRLGDLDQLEQLSAQYPSRERFITELTLDPPQASGDLAGPPHQDEDYLVLSTVHSAKGMEWDTRVRAQRRRRQLPVGVLDRPRRADRRGAAPAVRGHDPSAQRAAPVRAAEVPADAAVAARAMRTSTAAAAASSPTRCSSAWSRATFHGAHLGEAPLGEARAVTVDVGARLKDMW